MKYQIHNKDYKEYDRVVQTIMTNIFVEKERNGKFIIYNFDPQIDSHKLYFNVTAIAADLINEKVYLDMGLLDYIKFWKKRSKKRSNLKWFSPFHKYKMDDEFKVDTSKLMDFIADELDIKRSLFKEINDKYYGWID